MAPESQNGKEILGGGSGLLIWATFFAGSYLPWADGDTRGKCQVPEQNKGLARYVSTKTT